MNRSTAIGRMFRTNRPKARAEVVRVLRRKGGVVMAAAVELGISRRQMWRFIWREGLWSELDAIRAEANPQPAVHPLVARAQAVLAGRRGPC